MQAKGPDVKLTNLSDSLQEILSKESSTLDDLKAHITEEKKRVVKFFDKLKANYLEIIDEKMNLLLKELDDQVINLSLNFQLLSSTLERAKGNRKSEIPSSDSLIQNINSLSSTSELEKLLGSYESEIQEKRAFDSLLSDGASKFLEDRINCLAQDLARVIAARPTAKLFEKDIFPTLNGELRQVLSTIGSRIRDRIVSLALGPLRWIREL